jgi:hypothetical protein
MKTYLSSSKNVNASIFAVNHIKNKLFLTKNAYNED